MTDPFAGDPDLSLELIEIKARGGQAQGVLDLFPGVCLRTDLDLDHISGPIPLRHLDFLQEPVCIRRDRPRNGTHPPGQVLRRKDRNGQISVGQKIPWAFRLPETWMLLSSRPCGPRGRPAEKHLRRFSLISQIKPAGGGHRLPDPAVILLVSPAPQLLHLRSAQGVHVQGLLRDLLRPVHLPVDIRPGYNCLGLQSLRPEICRDLGRQHMDQEILRRDPRNLSFPLHSHIPPSGHSVPISSQRAALASFSPGSRQLLKARKIPAADPACPGHGRHIGDHHHDHQNRQKPLHKKAHLISFFVKSMRQAFFLEPGEQLRPRTGRVPLICITVLP